MIINTKEIENLIKSDVTAYAIYKATGISQSNLSNLRSGKRKIENLNLSTLMKMQTFINQLKEQHEMKTYKINGKEVTLDQLMESNYEGVEEGLYFEDYDLTVPLTNADIDEYVQENLGETVEDDEDRLTKYALNEDEIDRYYTEKYLEEN